MAVENVIVISVKLCIFQVAIIGAFLWSQNSHLFDLCGSTSVQSVEGNAGEPVCPVESLSILNL